MCKSVTFLKKLFPLDSDEQAQAKKEATAETVKSDCGIAYEGGKCTEGKDVENCIYKSANDIGIQGCSGLLEIVHINSAYMCKKQVGMYKCIKVFY